jgi:Zn finger protein HypA/HybF involved in hydrogenase expression
MYTFTDDDRRRSNEKARHEAIKKYFTTNTYPSNTWLRKALREYMSIEYKCSQCSISEWNGIDITLEIDHINGDNSDNRIENLRYLCPNCHSQTATYKGKNINSGKIKVTDDELINAFITEGNIRKALIKVGLSPRGANYNRMYKLLSAFKET